MSRFENLRLGWKVVTGERRPLCSSDPFGICWFHDKDDKLTAPEFLKGNVVQIVYKPGAKIRARDERTGKEFQSIEELVGARNQLGITVNNYGPSIHVYTAKESADYWQRIYNRKLQRGDLAIPVHSNPFEIITVVYDENDVVEGQSKSIRGDIDHKIGVFEVMVVS